MFFLYVHMTEQMRYQGFFTYVLTSPVKYSKPIHLPVYHVFSGAFTFLKYQLGSHIRKQNFEISCVKPSLASKWLLESNFLDEAMLCTSTHHFCTQSCSFNETSNFLMTFLTMDESWPILG